MSLFLFSQRFDKAVQLVQARLPDTPLALQPAAGRRESLRTQLAHPHPAGLAGDDDLALFENADVLHEARQRHAMMLGEIADARRTVPKLRDDRATRFVGQRVEDPVKVSHTAN